MDEVGWEKVFSAARDYGMNHLRFHSWCPPEAAFNVADRKMCIRDRVCSSDLFAIADEPEVKALFHSLLNYLKTEKKQK